MLRIAALSKHYESDIASQRLSDQGDDLDEELSKKRANPKLHFEIALKHLRSETDLGVNFETQNDLLINDLSELAASPGNLN
jgi:hypothetical protein